MDSLLEQIEEENKKLTWEKYNKSLIVVFGKGVQFSEMKGAIEILFQSGILNDSIKVKSVVHGFSYMSPSVILEKFNGRDKKISLLLTKSDIDFMLRQDQFPGFRIDSLIIPKNNLDPNVKYPRYIVSQPIYSLDKKAFAIKVEIERKRNCMEGNSYLIQTKEGKIVAKYQPDMVEEKRGCR